VSCCNPRGPSPGSLAATAAITVVLAVVCGGPLLRLVARLWGRVDVGWWLLAAGFALATGVGYVITVGRRGRRHRVHSSPGLTTRGSP